MSIITDLIRNILETSFTSFDNRVIEQAKSRIIDVVGCVIAGARASGCREMVELVRKWGGERQSTILVYGGKAPAHNVAMVNSIMARSYDFEPIHPYVDGIGFPAHISSTTVPTAIAVAELKAANGKELITSLILGDDLTSRLVAASNFSLDLGWDNTGTANMFGATAVAGRLWGLDEHQMLNAFGIVVNQIAGTTQNIYDGAHSFKLPGGLAARAGIFSVELASSGFTGVSDPLLSKHGYFSLYCKNYQPEVLTKNLGKEFYADGTFKPYPACRANHAGIQCALELIHSYDIKPEEVDEITIGVTASTRDLFVAQPFKIGDVPQVNATFSLQYNVANVLLRKSVELKHFTDEFIQMPEVLELVRKTRIEVAIPPDKPMATKIEVKTKRGQRFSAYVEVPKGDAFQNPLTKEEIKEKFRANVNFSGAVPIENAERALGMIEQLEEIDDIGEIIREIT